MGEFQTKIIGWRVLLELLLDFYDQKDHFIYVKLLIGQAETDDESMLENQLMVLLISYFKGIDHF